MDQTQLAETVADLVVARLGPRRISYSVAEAAAATGCTENAIRDAISTGTLPAKMRGRAYVITEEALMRWVRP